MGIDVTFVPPNDFAATRAAIRENTRLIYTETIGNPLGIVADLRAYAELAHEHGLPLMVDNTFASPILCRPIEFGAVIPLVVRPITDPGRCQSDQDQNRNEPPGPLAKHEPSLSGWQDRS